MDAVKQAKEILEAGETIDKAPAKAVSTRIPSTICT